MRPVQLIAALVVVGTCVVGGLAAHAPLGRSTAPPLRDAAATLSHEPRATALPAEPLLPLPTIRGLMPARVALGRQLFDDRRLSRDGSVACASCHDLARGGADGRRHSLGIGGAEGEVNAPSVLTSALNFAQFWDGRAGSLEEQVDGPLLSAAEMGSSWNSVIATLEADSSLAAGFRKAYAEGVTPDTVRDALASFERSLLAPAAIDDYLAGDRDALTANQLAGYQLFKELGCASCHQGANIGGNMFQTLGRVRPYYSDSAGTRADQGRFNVTRLERDRHAFKVPSLRNVALTAPYLHDGSAARLEDAIAVMAKYQLGTELSAEETRLLVAFLGSLTSRSVH